MFNFCQAYFLKENRYQIIMSLQSNHALLTSPHTKFEAIMPKEVEALAFLIKAVHHKRFQIKEAITFELYHLWG